MTRICFWAVSHEFTEVYKPLVCQKHERASPDYWIDPTPRQHLLWPMSTAWHTHQQPTLTVCHFIFWISLSLRPKTLRPNGWTLVSVPSSDYPIAMAHITAHSIMSSKISNQLTYLVHEKSTVELINFGFSDRSVRSLVSAKRSANYRVQVKHELSYRKQITCQLHTQYSEVIYKPKYYTVTLKSKLSIIQGHCKRNHWIDHTRLTISRVIWCWILRDLEMWVRGHSKS